MFTANTQAARGVIADAQHLIHVPLDDASMHDMDVDVSAIDPSFLFLNQKHWQPLSENRNLPWKTLEAETPMDAMQMQVGQHR